MYYVYLLRNESGRVYTGFTRDLRRRVKEHFRGRVYSSSRMGELKLIYYEAFVNERDAQERENYFKTTKGKRAVKIMLKHTFARFV